MSAASTRRHPRPSQFDYLHLQRLLDDLRPALAWLAAPGDVVLDVFCGSRPYDDLFAPNVRVVGLDIEDRYGVADIVSQEFLPGPDAATTPSRASKPSTTWPSPRTASESYGASCGPGGGCVCVPLVWEYDRAIPEHRYTTGSLRQLFAAWDDVEVIENGGRAVTWTLVTGTLLNAAEQDLSARLPRGLVRAAFKPVYVALNALGGALDAIERRRRHPSLTLPPNIMLTARRPADA